VRRVLDRLLHTPWFFEGVRNVIDPGQVSHLRRLLARVPHDSLLDIGCGVGNLCGMTDVHYLGVDRSPEYVHRAQQRYGSRTKKFLAADALRLDGSLGSFDVVSVINMIHHLSDEQVRELFRRLSAMKPGYLFVVDVALERAGWAFRHVFRRLDRGHFFRTTAAQRRLLEEGGVRVEWEDAYVEWPRIYPHSVILASFPARSDSARGG
jgi:cyclopropane fatty-acyl-phospholipid synthase-like methyltransferase